MDRPSASPCLTLKHLQDELRNCVHNHQDVCSRQRRTLLPTVPDPDDMIYKTEDLSGFHNLRVIDVNSLEVVQAPSDCQYVALSYVWERHKTDEPRKSTPQPSQLIKSDLPKTIVDAIEVCAVLGERYLWVDAICIRQNDAHDIIDQIAQMDKIYSHAIATLIAAVGTDPSQGLWSHSGLQLSSFPSESSLQGVLDKTLWSSRGWTYQELILSRRLLIFTLQGSFFHCAKNTTQRLRSWDLPSLGGQTCWEVYNRSLEVYTFRNLGRKVDTLNAISGVHRVFARYTNDAFLCGLPVRQLFYAILWQPVAVAERQPLWPSWSWAGWTGPGEELCQVINPAYHAVLAQWGDNSARWGSDGRVFRSCLGGLRFHSTNGDDVDIPLSPDNESLQQYLTSQFSTEKLPSLAPDRDFHDKGLLKFKATTLMLSIVPDDEHALVSEHHPLLKRYRLMQDSAWVGTMFLTPDTKGVYPKISDACEFIVVSEFSAYTSSIGSRYLNGLLSETEAEKEPAVFPADYYKVAHLKNEYQFKQWKSGQYHSKMGFSESSARIHHSDDRDPHFGMPYPAEVACKHVMWIDRGKDGIVYRKAIGIVIDDVSISDRAKEFCLG